MDGYWDQPKEYNEVQKYDVDRDSIANKIDFDKYIMKL